MIADRCTPNFVSFSEMHARTATAGSGWEADARGVSRLREEMLYAQPMNDEDYEWAPPPRRLLLAFATVPGIGAIVLATVQPLYAGLDSYMERIWRTALMFAIFAYPSGLIFGLPAYGFLRNRVRPTWLNCTLAGAIVAAAPWLIFAFLPSAANQASIGGRATVVDGATTAYGYLVALQFVGIIALCGAVAGFMFWLIAVARRNFS